MLDEVSFTVNKDDKIAFVGHNDRAKTTLFQILMGEIETDSGTYSWGVTTSQSYFPKDNSAVFDDHELPLVDWLRQYAPEDETETFLRGFFGRMLFSGEEAMKNASVLSGGEKVRCMLSKTMLSSANVLIFDEPTAHLDLESIQALNNGLIRFTGSILFTSSDQEFINSIANRLIEITPQGLVDKTISYDEYVRDYELQEEIEKMYE